jgi:ABC-type transport system involved in multi-copper enzyme maturation permease subunit
VIRQVRAELLKVRSTRTTIGLLLGMVALILLFILLTGLLASAFSLSTVENQRQFLSLSDLAGVFAALAGVMLVASEYRYGTMRPTILFTPHRSRVLVAKVIGGVLAGIAFSVVGEAIGWGLGYAIISGRGIPFALSTGDGLQLVLGGVGSVALWGAIGVGLAAILRNQVAAVITLLAWGFVVSPLLFGLVPSVGRFMPTYAGDGLIGLTTHHLLPAVAGGVVLVGWTALLAGVGIALTARRDVT